MQKKSGRKSLSDVAPLSVLTSGSRKFTTDYPDHPLVNDISHKAGLFDESAQLFDVPPVAAVGA